MKTYRSLFLLLLSLPLYAQLPGLNTGMMRDSVAVPGSQGETFTLYLPKSYKDNSPAPAIFVFDPAARGKTGITPFIPAADTYGYVLIGSNDSRNGPYDRNFKIAERLFAYCLGTYNINLQRIYTAGFSGGARLAATIAILSGGVEGVIGCGAGFAGFPYLPTTENHFSWVGLVGNRDMNYREMVSIPQWLPSAGISHELFVFKGDHQWPPGEDLLRAFDWLQLQAVKKGLTPANEPLMRKAFESHYRYASGLERDGEYVASALEYERLIKNYSNYFDTDSLRQRLERLRKSRPYRQEKRERERLGAQEDTLSSRYQRRFASELELGSSPDQFGWWEQQIKLLDNTYAKSTKPLYQMLGERLRYQLFAIAIETFDQQVEGKKATKAAYCADLLSVLEPDNAYIHYKLAQGLALLQRTDQAARQLLLALEHGFDNMETLRRSPELAPLLEHESIKKLTEDYKK